MHWVILRPTDAQFKDGMHTGKPGVSLVLGAGNFSVLAALDAIYTLVHTNHVVLVKVRTAVGVCP